MPYLDRNLRRQFASAIQQAREIAEEGAADAIRRLGVAEDKAPAHVTGAAAELRRRLRAHARTLDDEWDATTKRLLSTEKLKQAAAYEHWHRMLFGRFLVERGLLIHPEHQIAVGRDELAELARDEGLPDEWAYVERIAAPALPAVFKPDDPVLAMALAPEFAKRLRDIVAGLPEEVFTAEDSLGWTYQFWRAAEKDAVNKAGGKIGAAELPAVTQLFTEPYMVKFLLHNTLGAWWAGKVLAEKPDLARDAADEQTLRDACALPGMDWDFLRFIRDGEGGTGPWRPAAGEFPGWPQRAAEITFLDPCCGSGHFLVEAFGLLAALRMAEEGTSGEETARAVLQDNLHGLEIDGRCVQIAAFNVALAAWHLAGEPVALPQPHIAWVGAQPPARSEMTSLANGDAELRRALETLHDQFGQAPLLGSLLRVGGSDILTAHLNNQIDRAFEAWRQAEPERTESVVAARGMFDAFRILRSSFVLQATNVPFLGRGRQSAILAAYLNQNFGASSADVATAMAVKMAELARPNGTLAIVKPQSWQFLEAFRQYRFDLLSDMEINFVANLGPRAFETISGEAVSVSLHIATNRNVAPTHAIYGLGVSREATAGEKRASLLSIKILRSLQRDMRAGADFIFNFANKKNGQEMNNFLEVYEGFSRSDTERFDRFIWELYGLDRRWKRLCESGGGAEPYGGRSTAFLWEEGKGSLSRLPGAAKGFRGLRSWGVNAISVERTGQLLARLTTGECVAQNSVVLVPKNRKDFQWLYVFARSSEYREQLKQYGGKLVMPTSAYLRPKVDADLWRQRAQLEFPDGLPEPSSDNPTQWLFHGHPAYAKAGTELHVALARLAGYRWPAEVDPQMRLSDLARERVRQAAALPPPDADGLVTLHATGTDRPLADRLRAVLVASYGKALSPVQEAALVRAADELLDKKPARDASLEGWLRDRAFRQHCVLFQQRPFLWQVWDGGKDGFSAFLHYHRLDRAGLEKLTYTLLDSWIERKKTGGRTAEEGWARQLRQRLVAILDGQKPYDIFVRWKPPESQPIGWEPDLDDGVRLNIRPFIKAGVLRDTPKITWPKDRGTDPPSAPWHSLGQLYGGKAGDRINDHHLTLAEKREARGKTT